MTEKKVQENIELMRKRVNNLRETVQAQQKQIDNLTKIARDHQSFFESLTGLPVQAPSDKKVKWEQG